MWFLCEKEDHVVTKCPNPKVETRICNRCGKAERFVSQCVSARAVDEDTSGEVVWGACVMDEIPDVAVAGEAIDEE